MFEVEVFAVKLLNFVFLHKTDFFYCSGTLMNKFNFFFFLSLVLWLTETVVLMCLVLGLAYMGVNICPCQ
jgi:hypothetical protein